MCPVARFASLALPAVALSGCLFASREDVDQLEARVAALESRAAQNTGPSELRTTGNGAPGPMKQRQGERLLDEARALIDAGDTTAARTKLRECAVLYPESMAARTALQLVDALSAVGTPVRQVQVDDWVAGKPLASLDGDVAILLFDANSLDAVRDVAQFDRVTQSARAAGVTALALVRLSVAEGSEAGNDGGRALVHKVLADAMVSLPVGVETDAARALFNQANLPVAVIVRDGTITWIDHPSRITQESIKTLLR